MVLDSIQVHNFCGQMVAWGKDGADMSSSMHVDDKKKDNLVLGQCPAQGLDDTAIILGECPAQGLDDTAIISY